MMIKLTGFFKGKLGRRQRKVSQFVDIQHRLSEASVRHLVVFDIDHVVTQPGNIYCQMQTLKKYWFCYFKLMRRLSPQAREIAFNILVNDSPSELVDQNAPMVIEKLQLQQRILTVLLPAQTVQPLDHMVRSALHAVKAN